MGFFESLRKTLANEPSLHAATVKALENQLTGMELVPNEGAAPDLVYKDKDSVLLIEVKTGDPSLPMLSGTPGQMRSYADAARHRFLAKRIVSIVVTNQQVPDPMREELKSSGVQIVALKDRSKLSEEVSRLAEIPAVSV
jgi:hypothetical protein